uniref:Uncharacterized protein n=1 Tax=Daphnia galeata TaxID=27404 RepID=A0A8J2S2F5_9CRUS|nr:unnamed protein product [Daphnia galeata]
MKFIVLVALFAVAAANSYRPAEYAPRYETPKYQTTRYEEPKYERFDYNKNSNEYVHSKSMHLS